MSGSISHDITEAMCKLLAKFAVKGRLPRENQYGIDVAIGKSKDKFGQLLFHFVTPDDLEINLVFDLHEMKGSYITQKRYIDSRIEMLMAQLETARKLKQKEESILILPALDGSDTKQDLH